MILIHDYDDDGDDVCISRCAHAHTPKIKIKSDKICVLGTKAKKNQA